MSSTATARSYSNIAFIKYWGNRNDEIRLPSNGSISMNLKGVETVTTVTFDGALEADELTFKGNPAEPGALARVSHHLDHLRAYADRDEYARVTTENNFPTGAGIASSASAFAALTAAASAALGLDLDDLQMSRIARLGSGSASRSIPGGFVEWYAGEDDESSYATTIAEEDHWDLIDLVAVVSRVHKATGSTGGHALAASSPLQAARVAGADQRLYQCRQAIVERDFEALGDVVEHDALLMHAVMMTSHPPLIYWLPDTLRLIELVRGWRTEGLPVFFTIDAGPNVHIITEGETVDDVEKRLRGETFVQGIIRAPVGGKTELLGKPIED